MAKEKIEYTPYFSRNPGWAEQDPQVYWDNMCHALQRLKAGAGEHWPSMEAVVLTTLRDTSVAVDANGDALRPTIVWLDQRMATGQTPLNVAERGAVNMIGMGKTLDLIYRKSKSNWIKENEPEVWSKIHKFIMLSCYLNFRLTGEFRDSIASTIGHVPFDYKNKCWAKSNFDLKWKLFGIERSMLPELVEPGQMLGKVTSAAAGATGLPEGIAVIAGGSDKGCETLGVGCMDETTASVSFGTTATIQTTTKKYMELLRFMPAYPSVISDRYNPEIEVFRGYWMISWFMQEFSHRELLEAKEKNISPEELLTRRLEEVPPGCHGLMLQPVWSPDILNPEAKGAVIGFGDVHTRIHFYRSIIEGINYSLIEGLEKIENRTGQKMREIMVSGGGSQSDAICQISADMFNRPVKKIHTYETSALGAAILGFTGTGIYGTVQDAAKEMIHYTKEFAPREQNVDIYHHLYKKVLHQNLQKTQTPVQGDS